MKSFLTIKDISNIFNCSYKKASIIVKLPGFPKIKIGRNYYVDSESFEKWCVENQNTEIILVKQPSK